MKVLIVDDEAQVLEAVSRALRFEGIEADLSDSADKALKMMQKELYGIVILDVIMPGTSGLELLGKIKENSPLCNVIMMTGYASITSVVDAIAAGACDYFIKPFDDVQELIRVVKDAMARIERWRKTLRVRESL